MQEAKTEWPELVNRNVEEAEQTIRQENPNVQVHRVPQDSMVTMDWREDRVRVFYDENNNQVVRTPRVG